jgi:hypothetical protein
MFADRSDRVQSSRIGYNGPGDRMGMPTNGTLRITMKDGSTKEIDLSLVQELSVHH